MREKKNIINTKKESLIGLLNPIMNYLVSIENHLISETESCLMYTIGVPKNWIMETDLVDLDIIKETDTIKLIKIKPYDNSKLNVDEFYNYIINLIEKNLLIDRKRVELDEEINKLKNKFQSEQEELMNNLYTLENDGEETTN